MHVIAVRPTQGGWTVGLDSLGDNNMMFLTGGSAERAAHSLGQRIADAGQVAEVQIFVRDGRMAGRFPCGQAGVRQNNWDRQEA